MKNTKNIIKISLLIIGLYMFKINMKNFNIEMFVISTLFIVICSQSFIKKIIRTFKRNKRKINKFKRNVKRINKFLNFI